MHLQCKRVKSVMIRREKVHIDISVTNPSAIHFSESQNTVPSTPLCQICAFEFSDVPGRIPRLLSKSQKNFISLISICFQDADIPFAKDVPSRYSRNQSSSVHLIGKRLELFQDGAVIFR